eukprot:gene7912-1124_t
MIPLTGIQPRPEYDTYRTLLADGLKPRISQNCNNKAVTDALSCFPQRGGHRASKADGLKPCISQISTNKAVTVALSCFPQQGGHRASKFWVYKGAVLRMCIYKHAKCQLAPHALNEHVEIAKLILRMGIYELTERQLAPHALNEHVEIAKIVMRPSSGGFTNGVLRSAARALEKGSFPTPERAERQLAIVLIAKDVMHPSSGGFANGVLWSAARVLMRGSFPTPEAEAPLNLSGKSLIKHMAIAKSHPTWMVSRWVKRFGEDEASEILDHNNRWDNDTTTLKHELRPPKLAVHMVPVTVALKHELRPPKLAVHMVPVTVALKHEFRPPKLAVHMVPVTVALKHELGPPKLAVHMVPVTVALNPPVYGLRLNPNYAGVEQKMSTEGDNQDDADSSNTGSSRNSSNRTDDTDNKDFVRVEAAMHTLIAEGFVSRGECFVEDESVGLLVAHLNPQPGDTILDCGLSSAARTIHLTQRLDGQGKVITLDTDEQRLSSIENAVEAVGLTDHVHLIFSGLSEFEAARPADANLFDKAPKG